MKESDDRLAILLKEKEELLKEKERASVSPTASLMAGSSSLDKTLRTCLTATLKSPSTS